MPNLRGKTWTTTTPANVEDAQYWEDHLISDEDAAKIGTVILPAGGTVGQVLTKQSSSPNDADWDDPASSGHTIQDEDGTDMPYQQTLQFVNAEVSNDSANDRTVVDCKGAKGDAATITVGTVSTLPAGSSATVVNSGTTKDAVFDFGIPKGADGTDGTDGFSPAVTITSIPGGHQVNITDEDHPQGQTFNVMDGAGTGDMQASAYDPNNDVYNAGGIPAYLADEIVANPTGTPTDDLTSIQIGSTIYRLKGGGMEIIQIPSVVGDSFTYDGTAQGAAITGLDTTHCTVVAGTGTTVTTVGDTTYVKATNAGSYSFDVQLNDTSSMVWSDLTTADKSYLFTIAKASQTISASPSTISLDYNTQTANVTISGAITALSATSSDTGIATVSGTSSPITITAVATGSATISVQAASSSNYEASNTVTITVSVALVPTGSTVTPTDDIQTWLHCANIWDKSYTTINEVLADSTTLLALISSNNAADYMKRSTTWASTVTANSTAMTDIGANNYCADALLDDSAWSTAICNSTYFENVLTSKVPTMTSNTAPQGKVTFYPDERTGSFDGYMAFDGNTSTMWCTYNNNSVSNAYIQYEFPSALKCYKAVFSFMNQIASCSYKMQASKDGTNYTDVTDSYSSTSGGSYILRNVDTYKYYRLYITSQTTTQGATGRVNKLQFYGRA